MPPISVPGKLDTPRHLSTTANKGRIQISEGYKKAVRFERCSSSASDASSDEMTTQDFLQER